MKVGPLLLIAVLGCSTEEDGPPTPTEDLEIQLEVVASGLRNPVHLTAPASDTRLFIVEQEGRIRIIQNGQLLSTPFLDIVSRVGSGGEQGLLSVAFHPQYRTNGFFYVNYTDRSGHTNVERYTVTSDPNRADPASARRLILIQQPYSNHNGGHIVFGPDNMLYIAMGDGGSGGDPQNHGQDRSDLLGDMLRIDVSGDPYTVPSDNPFRNVANVRSEIWAYGLRNPWRIAFDRIDGNLYIADVGQNQVEEINVVRSNAAGLNYGWRIMEGSRCYNPMSNCTRTGLTMPVIEYSHSEGCSVTGGLVYRGRITSLRGHYFYGDYCQGWIRSFRYSNGQAADARSWAFGNIGSILSFGEDANGELYVLTSNGMVRRLVEQ
ncbi:MAG: PQQ-dependent sugar dehydrogenase [Longimicrobiales bacterium]